MTDKTLLEAAKAALKWADALKPYADDGTQVVPVFEELREAIAQGDILAAEFDQLLGVLEDTKAALAIAERALAVKP